jgi:hypothetical protein
MYSYGGDDGNAKQVQNKQGFPENISGNGFGCGYIRNQLSIVHTFIFQIQFSESSLRKDPGFRSKNDGSGVEQS